jgi:hypothetical protein
MMMPDINTLSWGLFALGFAIAIPLFAIGIGLHELTKAVQEGYGHLEKISKDLGASLERIADRLDPQHHGLSYTTLPTTRKPLATGLMSHDPR